MADVEDLEIEKLEVASSAANKKKKKKKKAGSGGAANGDSQPDASSNTEVPPAGEGEGGASTAAKKKKKKKKGGGGGVQGSHLKQTSPPSVPVAHMFPDGNFPLGEICEYNDNLQRMTNEEKRAMDVLTETEQKELRHASVSE